MYNLPEVIADFRDLLGDNPSESDVRDYMSEYGADNDGYSALAETARWFADNGSAVLGSFGFDGYSDLESANLRRYAAALDSIAADIGFGVIDDDTALDRFDAASDILAA